MDALPLRRIVIYAIVAVVALAVGAWVVAGGGAAEGEPVEIGVAAPGGSTEEGRVPAAAPGPADDTAGGDVQVRSAGATGQPATTTTTAPSVFVQVAGEVNRPGVYEVPAGSRVFEVLARAGGVTASGDEQALPLAAVVLDGARIVVPANGVRSPSGEVPRADPSSGLETPGTSAGGAAGGGSGPLSLATATAEQLDELPGIGPSLAGRIVAYRDAHGPFSSVAELEDVPGIGPATVARLEGLVVP